MDDAEKMAREWLMGQPLGTDMERAIKSLAALLRTVERDAVRRCYGLVVGPYWTSATIRGLIRAEFPECFEEEGES